MYDWMTTGYLTEVINVRVNDMRTVIRPWLEINHSDV